MAIQSAENRRVPVLFAVLLACLMLAALGYQAYQFNKTRLGKMSIAVSQESSSPRTPGMRVSGLVDIARMNLMGDPNKSMQAPVVKEVQPVSTITNLVLMGIITSSIPEKSSALIQESNTPTKRYFIGQSLASGYILDSVNIDSVVLKRGEQKETLRYPVANTFVPAPPLAAQMPFHPVVPTPGTQPQQQQAPAVPAQAPAAEPDLRSRLYRLPPLTPGGHPREQQN